VRRGSRAIVAVNANVLDTGNVTVIAVPNATHHTIIVSGGTAGAPNFGIYGANFGRVISTSAAPAAFRLRSPALPADEHSTGSAGIYVRQHQALTILTRARQHVDAGPADGLEGLSSTGTINIIHNAQIGVRAMALITPASMGTRAVRLNALTITTPASSMSMQPPARCIQRPHSGNGTVTSPIRAGMTSRLRINASASACERHKHTARSVPRRLG